MKLPEEWMGQEVCVRTPAGKRIYGRLVSDTLIERPGGPFAIFPDDHVSLVKT